MQKFVSKESIKLAVRNIASWGDTDVLPFPLENHWFHDEEDKVVNLLCRLNNKYHDWIFQYPPTFERCLSNVGYTGYRGVTQIDPIWNAYLLALVIEAGPEIESKRIPIEDNQIFSYRFSPDQTTCSLFNVQVGWRNFQTHALELSKRYGYVLFTDVSDFYPRIYHHRLENDLRRLNIDAELCNRIKILLNKLSISGVSYGLPIGGNAARLLAELILNRTDRLLKTKGIKFCRFVDDYYLFANSEEEVRNSLVYLSEILLNHEGLSLNRGKTRLMTQDEFAKFSPAVEASNMESESHSQAQAFFKLRLKYDPYSPTAEDEYIKLKNDLEQFDIVGMLAREFRKSRIDEALTKQLVKSLKFLNAKTQSAAIESIVSNLELLYPIFPTVSIVLRSLISDSNSDLTSQIFTRIRSLLYEQSHILKVPTNLAFALRLLADDPSEETIQALVQIYSQSDSRLVRRDVILCMAKLGVEYWLADVIRSHAIPPNWFKRALIAGSFVLDEEGKHWRKRIQNQLHDVDKSFMDWINEKHNLNSWKIPI